MRRPSPATRAFLSMAAFRLKFGDPGLTSFAFSAHVEIAAVFRQPEAESARAEVALGGRDENEKPLSPAFKISWAHGTC